MVFRLGVLALKWVKFLGVLNIRFSTPIVLKELNIGGAVAPPAPPITTSLLWVIPHWYTRDTNGTPKIPVFKDHF